MRLVFCALIAASIAGAQAPKKPIDPHSLVLFGDRFKPLKYDDMTAEQKIMVDHLLSGERGGVRGPFNVLLRSPEVGDLGAEFGGAMRFRNPFPAPVRELIILMTGRYWMAQYEWHAHKIAAIQAGLSSTTVDAIATGKRPKGMQQDLEIAYDFIDELLTSHQVANHTFKAAKEKFAERGVFDMIALSGWYGLVSMVLDVDRYPVGDGIEPELKPLENPLPVVGMGFATPVPGPVSPMEVKSSANGKAFTMLGDRFKPLSYEQMTPEQKKMTDIAVSQRGTGGSFNINVRDPDGGQLFFNMGDRVRFHMSVPDKLKELAICLTARYWGAQYEWLAHRRAGIQAGLTEDQIKAIAEGRRPTGMSSDEEAVYNFITELFKTKQVTDDTFAALKSVVGERGVVDLIVTAGYYQAVSMLMNADRMPVNANQQPELKYIAKPLH
jgi:4-carboxymuconolactone decarboxylase